MIVLNLATDGSNLKIKLTSATEEIQTLFDETVRELILQQADEVYMQGEDDEVKEICESVLGIIKGDKSFIDCKYSIYYMLIMFSNHMEFIQCYHRALTANGRFG